MKFGIEKCSVLELKRLVMSEGIELQNGERLKEIDQEGYKYLGVPQLDKTMNKEIKENIGNVTLNTSGTGSIPNHDTKVNSAFHPSEKRVPVCWGKWS